MQADNNQTERLLLKPDEAAAALSISPRLLWSLTKKGRIKCLRVGRVVRYDPRDLIDWIDQQKNREKANMDEQYFA